MSNFQRQKGEFQVPEPRMSLKTPKDLIDAHEWLFNQQKENKIDAKTADALNTTLKGAVYLNAKLRLDAAKIFLTAQIKKIEIPKGFLPGTD
jgi:hypothetical protein